jgi:hypothetical protein
MANETSKAGLARAKSIGFLRPASIPLHLDIMPPYQPESDSIRMHSSEAKPQHSLPSFVLGPLSK